MLKLYCSLVQLSAGGKDVMQPICYDAGNISIATRIANMMIARIVTLSKSHLPSHQRQHRLTADSITVTCDDVHTAQLNQNNNVSQQQFAHLCHIGSTVTDTKRHGGPDMLGVYKRHVCGHKLAGRLTK